MYSAIRPAMLIVRTDVKWTAEYLAESNCKIVVQKILAQNTFTVTYVLLELQWQIALHYEFDYESSNINHLLNLVIGFPYFEWAGFKDDLAIKVHSKKHFSPVTILFIITL